LAQIKKWKLSQSKRVERIEGTKAKARKTLEEDAKATIPVAVEHALEPLPLRWRESVVGAGREDKTTADRSEADKFLETQVSGLQPPRGSQESSEKHVTGAVVLLNWKRPWEPAEQKQGGQTGESQREEGGASKKRGASRTDTDDQHLDLGYLQVPEYRGLSPEKGVSIEERGEEGGEAKKAALLFASFAGQAKVKKELPARVSAGVSRPTQALHICEEGERRPRTRPPPVPSSGPGLRKSKAINGCSGHLDDKAQLAEAEPVEREPEEDGASPDKGTTRCKLYDLIF